VQNINIVYKVDKSDVEKSNQAVQQARNLTDQLKNASKSFTDQASKGNKEFQGSLEGLKIKLAQLRAQIDLTSRSDSARLNKLIGEYKQVKHQVDEFNKSLKEVNRTQPEAAKGSQNLSGGLMGMYNAMRLIMSAAIVRELVDITLEMARLNGQTEAVGNAFARQIPMSEALLARLRKATHGTIGDLELMQRALKFQNFGADVQKLPQLLEFAAIRAQQTGESVDYMVNSIVNGIGRKSLLILDNLGISAARLKEEFHGVSLQALSVAEVTQGVANIMEEEMAKMGGYAENSATTVDQITVAVQELKVELAKRIESGGFLDFFKEVLAGAKLFIQAFPKMEAENFIPVYGFFKTIADFRENLQELTKVQEAHRQATEEYLSWEKEANKERETALKLAQEQIVLNVKMLNRNKEQQESWEKRIELMEEDRMANIGMIEEGKKALRHYDFQNAKLEKSNELYRAYIVNLMTVKDAVKEAGKAVKESPIEFDPIDLNPYFKINMSEIEGFKDNFNPNFKLDVPVEIEPEIIIPEWDAQGGWQGGNEKMARFRLAMKEWFKQNQEEIIAEGISFTSDMLQLAVDAELASYEKRLDNLRNYYDTAMTLAGNNERYKKEIALREQRDTRKLEREQAQAQKRARLYSIAIDTAASIARAWVNPGYPGAIPLTIFIAAQGAAQAAIVNRTAPGFKEGVIDLKGPGTTKSDSITARLSKGESVMTAEETQSSMRTLKMIRAKKLNDKVVERLARQAQGSDGGGWDDSRLVKVMSEVAKNTAANDLIQKGSVIYEVKKYRENLKSYIKSKY
jgi:hypothetical protein